MPNQRYEPHATVSRCPTPQLQRAHQCFAQSNPPLCREYVHANKEKDIHKHLVDIYIDKETWESNVILVMHMSLWMLILTSVLVNLLQGP